jgi:putative DNA primase/helicase
VATLAVAAGAVSVAIVTVPSDWRVGWDLADPVPEGTATDVLVELLQLARPWTPPAPSRPNGEVDDAVEIARLAALAPLAYERERQAAAKRLDCRAPILDRLVAGARNNGATTTGQGRALDLYEPEPWPHPVDGATLLDQMAATVRRHVVLGETEAAAVALWVIATHAFDAFSIFPRLFVTAPERGCGKTTLLDVLSCLVGRPLAASSIKAAALFRTIETAQPTLLLDEADAYVRSDEDLRSVLDSGHSRRGSVIRCVGDDHEPRQFSTWAPVALAAIGHLPGTIEDRSIRIGMRRRRPDEKVESLRLDRAEHLERLACMAARWAADHAARLATADPAIPAGIVNRAADNWRPLLAVADLAGGGWPERGRGAAIGLSLNGEETVSAKVLLLADLRSLFDREPNGVLFTREVLAALHQDETRPWPEWKNGKPITDRQLAALLKEFKIVPRTVRRAAHTEKGYRLEWFEDIFARYLPPRSVTGSQMRESTGFEMLRSVTPAREATSDVTDRGQHVDRGYLRDARRRDRARRFRGLALDNQRPPARGVPRHRRLGLYVQDDAHLGEGQDGHGRLAARADRALPARGARASNADADEPNNAVIRTDARAFTEAMNSMRSWRRFAPAPKWNCSAASLVPDGPLTAMRCPIRRAEAAIAQPRQTWARFWSAIARRISTGRHVIPVGDRQHPEVRDGLHTLGSVSGLTRYTQAGTAAAVALGPLRAIELAAKLIATALPKLRVP